ncbi:28910_t:CDS:2, partial [Dentiscutata erythropus]
MPNKIIIRYIDQCFVTPQKKPRVYVIRVNSDITVGELKKYINQDKNLTLWKVDIPEDDKRIKKIKTSSLVEKVFNRKFEKFSDRGIIEEIFESPHKENNIHIVASIGKSPTSAFPVKINKYANVYTLSKAIIEKIILPENKELILWKVDIPVNNEDNEKINPIKIDQYEELSNITKTINNIFEFPLKEENIHIVVSFAKDPKAYITFLHSSLDHIGFYDHVFSKFKDKNIEVNAFDRCGQGRTWKKNGNPSVGKGWEVASKEIKEFVKKQERKKGASHFLMGHGVRGLFALVYAEKEDKNTAEGKRGLFDGYIALSPALKLHNQGIDVPEILIRAGKLVNRMIPNFTIMLEIDSEHLTANGSFSQVYDEHTYINRYSTLIEVYYEDKIQEIIDKCEAWILPFVKHSESSQTD